MARWTQVHLIDTPGKELVIGPLRDASKQTPWASRDYCMKGELIP
jgi:hypothetical protein